MTSSDSGARHPVFSWDGSRVAFSSDRKSPGAKQSVEDITPLGLPVDGDLFVIDASGGQSVQFTEGPYLDQRPCFSPDGSTIVFVSNREDRLGLWSVPSDGTADPQPLPNTGFVYRPWFSTDGRTLFLFRDVDGRHQICRIGVSDTEFEPLRNDDRGRSHGPFVDPNGKVLLFHSTRTQS
ncbi:MAG: hypothetical protein GY725_04445 [bacterium]|nr:hypothetical protein [bacterium]